jgi:hypothetical protein
VSPIGHTGSRPDDTSSAPHESRAYRILRKEERRWVRCWLSLFVQSDSVGGLCPGRCFCLRAAARLRMVRRLAALSMIVPSERLPRVV